MLGQAVRFEPSCLTKSVAPAPCHLIPEVAHPIRLRRPSSGTALATANHPVKFTEPDVRPTAAPIGRKHRRRVPRSFAQKHPDKRRRRADQIPQIHAPGLRRVIVEDIRHARAKDAAALAGGEGVAVPPKRPALVGFARALAFSMHVPFVVAPAEPFGSRRGVTSIAGRTHACASYPWIERRMSRSDLRNGSH
jgi:hypothetical protein